MIKDAITASIIDIVDQLYHQKIPGSVIQIEKTNPDFEGDFTLVVFPLLKISRKSPEMTAKEIGDRLCEVMHEIEKTNVIKGFLNITLKNSFWIDRCNQIFLNEQYFSLTVGNGKKILIEFSSPNTNKPLHLGHIRNNLIGWSVAQILEASGYHVIKANLVNDRGIHICKSMLAWQKWGQGETPESTGMKGDHLAGKYYVLFDKELKKEMAELNSLGKSEEEALQEAPLMIEAQAMLRCWENNDPQVRKLWETMNAWVYKGFDETYHHLGVNFDIIQYESDTYLLGKNVVIEGLEKNVFYKKEDGSVWIDLTQEGLDEKILLRSDGTSVYMTQDIGTAQLRNDELNPDQMIYVVGNEQNYHFDVLKLILKKAGREWSERILHLSYGMVELPEGKMKSREGTVVDADDLLDEMFLTAKKTTEELGKTENFSKAQADELYNMIGSGALKYFILKVDPKKNMLFNPSESVDFNGNTGPFIQYTHARICSLIKKATASGIDFSKVLPANVMNNLLPRERNIIRLVFEFPTALEKAAESLSPAIIANYLFELTKEYNGFYQEVPVLKEPDSSMQILRLQISSITQKAISMGMKLLGISVPEQM